MNPAVPNSPQLIDFAMEHRFLIQARRCASLLTFTAFLWCAVPSTFSATSANASPARIDFNRDIQPILSDKCFTCHGPDDKERKAKLRFDHAEDALKPAKSGDFAIVPGNVAKSKLLERILSHDPDEMMPPPKTGPVHRLAGSSVGTAMPAGSD